MPFSCNKPLAGMPVTVYTNCALVLSKSVVSKRVPLITAFVAPSETVIPVLVVNTCSSFTGLILIARVTVTLASRPSVRTTDNTLCAVAGLSLLLL